MRLQIQDEDSQPRRARQVKREVKAFLVRLEQDTALDAQDSHVAQHLIRTILNRWWARSGSRVIACRACHPPTTTRRLSSINSSTINGGSVGVNRFMSL